MSDPITLDILGERLDAIRDLIEKQNGRVAKLELDVTSLKVRFAYGAGACAALVVLARILF